MVSQKFSNIAEESYVAKMIGQLNTEAGKSIDDEQALRLLIDLTDELRRRKKYSSEHKELIFGEVDKRVAAAK